MTSEQFLDHLQNNLHDRHLLDENRNLSLANSSEQDFLELFFMEKVFPQDKQLSLFFALYNKRETRLNKKRLTYPALYKIVKEAVLMAGRNARVTPHWFRHTFVTTLLENDVPLAVVKDWAGHLDISTTNIYLERVNQDNTHVHLNKVNIFK